MKVTSILTSKCPTCDRGKMYNHGPYKLSEMTKINHSCDHCGQNFLPEPSFYTGAMYVSYAFSVAIVVTTFVAFNVLSDDPNVGAMMFTSIFATIVLAPLIFRLSRNIWAALALKRKVMKKVSE